MISVFNFRLVNLRYSPRFLRNDSYWYNLLKFRFKDIVFCCNETAIKCFQLIYQPIVLLNENYS